MRYFIKAYPMHEEEVDALASEAKTGGVDGDVHEGLVVGTADADAIERLVRRGIVVQAVGTVPEEAPPVSRPAGRVPGVEFRTRARLDAQFGAPAEWLGGHFDARVRVPEVVPRYWLADLLTGVTDRTIGLLADAGAEIVERDPSGALVLRTTDGDERLRGLPFLEGLRPYGVAETLPPATGETIGRGDNAFASAGRAGRTGPAGLRPAGPPGATEGEVGPSAGRFEAICHLSEDLGGVAQGIEALGGQIISSTGRAVRFILNKADLEGVARLEGVASVSAATSPQLRCDLARPIIGLERPGAPLHAMPFDGRGELIGVADTGIDSGHPDFAAKRLTAVPLGRPGDSSDPDGHGTHVAGTIAGDGTASRPAGAPPGDPAPLRGIAPAADLYVQSVLDANGGLGGLPPSLVDLLQPAYDAGVRIHNNSWGAYIQSRYDSMALDIDGFVHNHPDFLPVIAAGNEGSCRPGLAAQPGFVDYPSLGSPAASKNGITVGASRSSRTSGGLAAMTWQQAWPQDFNAGPIGGETVSGNPEGLAAFSSRGPCDEVRIKPDLVAPGTDIAATRSSRAPLSHFWGAYPKNRFYAFMGGTSMACPVVTGCAALVRQYYRTEREHAEPSAALLKATLINGTTRLTSWDAIAPPDGKPNYHQGFGRIDMARTIPDPREPEFELFFVDTWRRDQGLRLASRSLRLRWEFVVKVACELRITLAWTDYPGRGVQNHVRIILDTRKAGQVVNWVGNADAVTPVKFPAHDPRLLLPGNANLILRDPHNNVQIIRAQVEPGSHMLALFADGLIFLPQDFALVATYPVDGVDMAVA